MRAGAAGGALIALAGHVALLRAFGTPLPYRDQWRCTAVDILFPWVNDRLHAADFFTPLNDHWPVLTRALSFLLVRLNGQWNNLVEASFNALLFSAAIATFLLVVLPGLRGWLRPAFALLTGAVFALPITWENTLWGIQSLVYLQILFSLIYLAAVCTQRRFSGAWWGGQIIGGLLLLTQHSAILAHFAVVALLGWRWLRRDGDRRVALAGLAQAVSAIALFAAFFPSLHETAALRADSWPVGLDVFLRQLAFPLPHPAWAFFVYLPWLVWMFDRLNRRRLDPVDSFLLVLGLWVGAQAAAIGYGRGAATYTFVSRYCDFLLLGFLVNAACLIRLTLAYPSRRVFAIITAFAVIWLIAPIRSFQFESTESHAGYNLSRRNEENMRNQAALRAYFSSHDSTLISDDNGRGLYSYPPELLPLLDHPGFQALLPPETGAPSARKDHGRVGWIPVLLLPSAKLFGLFGLLALLWSGAASRRAHVLEQAELVTTPGRIWWLATGLLGLVALICAGAALAWDAPLVFSREARLAHIFHPPNFGATFTPLAFVRGDGNEHPAVIATGAVASEPPDARAFAYGTRLSGPTDFRGILHSQPIAVNHAQLVVPFTGYPCANGNGLRWRFFDPRTRTETWVSYVGPNPGSSWAIWAIDASAHVGAEASLYLFDGREDTSGWVGVAQPAQSDDPRLAERWPALIRSERTDSAHLAFAGLAVIAGLSAVGLALYGLKYSPRGHA